MHRSLPSLRSTLLAMMAAALGGTVVWLASLSRDALQSPRFQTGWLAVAALCVLALATWWDPADMARLRRGLQMQLALTSIFIVVALVHIEFCLPQGAFDRVLGAGVVALLGSLAVGLRLSRAGRAHPESPPPGWWLALHSAVMFAVLTLSLVHGVFSSTHGLLAHLLEGGAS